MGPRSEGYELGLRLGSLGTRLTHAEKGRAADRRSLDRLRRQVSLLARDVERIKTTGKRVAILATLFGSGLAAHVSPEQGGELAAAFIKAWLGK